MPLAADSLDAVTGFIAATKVSRDFNQCIVWFFSCAFHRDLTHTRDVIAGAGVAGTCFCNRCQSDITSEKFRFNVTKTRAARFGVTPAPRLRRWQGDRLLAGARLFWLFSGGDARKLLMLEVEFFRYLKSGDLVSQKAG